MRQLSLYYRRLFGRTVQLHFADSLLGAVSNTETPQLHILNGQNCVLSLVHLGKAEKPVADLAAMRDLGTGRLES